MKPFDTDSIDTDNAEPMPEVGVRNLGHGVWAVTLNDAVISTHSRDGARRVANTMRRAAEGTASARQRDEVAEHMSEVVDDLIKRSLTILDDAGVESTPDLEDLRERYQGGAS